MTVATTHRVCLAGMIKALGVPISLHQYTLHGPMEDKSHTKHFM